MFHDGYVLVGTQFSPPERPCRNEYFVTLNPIQGLFLRDSEPSSDLMIEKERQVSIFRI